MIWANARIDIPILLTFKLPIGNVAFTIKGRTAFHRFAAFEHLEGLQRFAATLHNPAAMEPQFPHQTGHGLTPPQAIAQACMKDMAHPTLREHGRNARAGRLAGRVFGMQRHNGDAVPVRVASELRGQEAPVEDPGNRHHTRGNGVVIAVLHEAPGRMGEARMDRQEMIGGRIGRRARDPIRGTNRGGLTSRMGPPRRFCTSPTSTAQRARHWRTCLGDRPCLWRWAMAASKGGIGCRRPSGKEGIKKARWPQRVTEVQRAMRVVDRGISPVGEAINALKG